LKTISAVPNPSTGHVRILYRLPKTAVVTLEIFDASGSLVRRLGEGPQAAGTHETDWDGRNDVGEELGAGVYLTRIETQAGVTTGKLVLAGGR
jgi:flagellar hook assembly protein FlgD